MLGKQDTTLASAESAPPSVSTVFLLSFFSAVLFVIVVSIFRNYFAVVDEFGDNAEYIKIASSIRHWSFQGLEVKEFWGLPYLMAAVSLLTGASDRTALLLISFGASFAAIILASRLWDGWVASFFAVLNFDWMQRSFLGGAEPLFIFLLFWTFWAARRQNWLLAALLASLDTLVRPVGLFALIAIGVTLLRRREFQRFTLVTLTGLTVGGLYVVPLAGYLGSPLVNVSRYQQADWDNGLLIGWPFHAIIKGTMLYPVPWSNLLLTYGWIILMLLAAIAMLTTRKFRQFARSHPVEMLFTANYLVFLYTYNSSYWARGAFARFALPALPVALIALDSWIPKNKLLLWSVGLVFPILAAASAIGIRNVIRLIPSL